MCVVGTCDTAAYRNDARGRYTQSRSSGRVWRNIGRAKHHRTRRKCHCTPQGNSLVYNDIVVPGNDCALFEKILSIKWGVEFRCYLK